MGNYIWLIVVLWPIVTFLAVLFANSFLKSYLSKKGENVATHQDIEKLVDQMKAVTQATEEIKAEISDQVWNRQRLWELKRDTLLATSRSLAAFKSALIRLASTQSVLRENPESAVLLKENTAAIQKLSETFKDFKESVMAASLVVGADVRKSLSRLEEQSREISLSALAEDAKAYEKNHPQLGVIITETTRAIRKELGFDE